MTNRERELPPIHVEFDAGRRISQLAIFLICCELLFVVADAVINVGRLTELSPIRRFFNITREDGLASWFAVTQTFMLGLTSAALYAVVNADGADRWRRTGWAVLAVFFFYMAVDDGALFHERIGSSVKMLLHGQNANDVPIAGFFPSYTWQLVFVPLFGTFGLFILWFLNRELLTPAAKLQVLAAICLLVLAVTADFFEGMQLDAPFSFHGYLAERWNLSAYTVRHYSKSLEEFMEMLAMTLLWIVLLRHLVQIAPNLSFRLNTDSRRDGANKAGKRFS